MFLRPVKAIALGMALLLALTGCDEIPSGQTPPPDPELTAQPTGPLLSGYTATGRNNPDVPANPYADECFLSLGGFTIYTAEGAASHVGVDVSAHQREIDWQQVKSAGIEFAMLRAGFRGYTGGSIYQDSCFEDNIRGALDAGLKVGVYFFSQAVSTAEAVEEAETLLEWIRPYDLAYPVVFDWESITTDDARTDHVSPQTVTDCVKAFCSTVEAEGYTPMVYFNRNQAYKVMDLTQLGEYEFWLANYSALPGFDYSFHMWQYSCTGSVPGIEGDVDLDVCMVDYPRASLGLV